MPARRSLCLFRRTCWPHRFLTLIARRSGITATRAGPVIPEGLRNNGASVTGRLRSNPGCDPPRVGRGHVTVCCEPYRWLAWRLGVTGAEPVGGGKNPHHRSFAPGKRRVHVVLQHALEQLCGFPLRMPGPAGFAVTLPPSFCALKDADRYTSMNTPIDRLGPKPHGLESLRGFMRKVASIVSALQAGIFQRPVVIPAG